MSQFTYYSLSVEKGLRGNIGRITVAKTKNGDVYMDVMLFLTANNNYPDQQHTSQIVNVHFPKELFALLDNYGVNDYVRIHFDRIDLARGISNKSGNEVLYIAVKANNIELLRKADNKKHNRDNDNNKSHQ